MRFPDVGTLPIALGQTFGVEIELTGPDGVPRRGASWTKMAKLIIEQLRATAARPVCPNPLAYHRGADLTTWRVTEDASAGHEIIGPILINAWGFEELRGRRLWQSRRTEINYR